MRNVRRYAIGDTPVAPWLSHTEAAGLGLAGPTAWQALVDVVLTL